MSDIPAWIAAIGTVGTLSTGTIIFAGQLADRRQRHASLVAVWLGLDEQEGQVAWRLYVKNNDGQPIYNCNLNSRFTGIRVTRKDSGKTITVDDVTMDVGFGIIPPSDTRSNVAFIKLNTKDLEYDISEINEAIRFTVSFTDTEGRSWIRDERGRLRRKRQVRFHVISSHLNRILARKPVVDKNEADSGAVSRPSS